MTDSLLKPWVMYCADGHCPYRDVCEDMERDCPVLKFVNYIGRKEFYQACLEQLEADLIECQRDIKNYAEVIKKMDSRWNELRDVYLMSLTQTEGELKDAIRIMNDQIALMKKIVYRYD